MMKPRSLLFVAATLIAAGTLYAQQYPMVDLLADEVNQKYGTSSCQQLWQAKGQPKSDRENEIIRLMREDPQVRGYFIKKVADTIVNKMFECAMLP
jgi:hypothetical protein